MLPNEGLYRRFRECAEYMILKEFCRTSSTCMVGPARETEPHLMRDCSTATMSERQVSLMDVLSTFPVFLFCLDTLRTHNDRVFFDEKLSFYRLRQLFDKVWIVMPEGAPVQFSCVVGSGRRAV
jgi:hypothetical protein